ncbi:MAG: tagaturonate reductase, partial [Saprospiraceae bacterium]|nr:tagaturonate reductase [Saprospiraceae bacterium]
MTKSTPLNANSDQSRDIKVLQFGGGNFMRAYLDWMVQRLNDDFEFAGGVALVKPTGGPQYQDLEEQGGRYHVVTSGIKDKEVIQKIDLITCIDQIYYPYDDFTAFIELAKQESILIITSNTTESGIVFAPGDTPDQTPPDSFPGKLCVFLRARYEFFAGALDRGFFILPCELIADNGKTLETIVLKLAQTWYEDSAFNHWIKQANTFVNTL